MTIYVDDLQYPDIQGKLWCHMWTDGTDAELDQFALLIGLKQSWSHTSNGISGRFYHYDLLKAKRAQALRNGAVYIALRDWIKMKLEAS